MGYSDVVIAVIDVKTNTGGGKNQEAFIERKIGQTGNKWDIVEIQEGPETLVPEAGTWVPVRYMTSNSDEVFAYQNSR